MGFPPPQYSVPLLPDDVPVELPYYPIYGVTPSNKYIPISIDSMGRLNVNATLTGTITLAEIGAPDESSFFFGSSLQQSVGGAYSDTAPNLAPGEQGVFRMTAPRALHTNLRDSTGAEVFPSLESTSVSINAGLETLNSLVPSVYDYIALAYTGNNLTQAVFKLGGAGGSTVSTLTLAYTGSNLTSVTKT